MRVGTRKQCLLTGVSVHVTQLRLLQEAGLHKASTLGSTGERRQAEQSLLIALDLNSLAVCALQQCPIITSL